MKKQTIGLLFLCIPLISMAQSKYRTSVFQPEIKTLQIGVEGQRFMLPVIELKGSDHLVVSFDQMSHNIHSYSYRVLHCNANWTLSSLNTNEYLSGYTNSPITDIQLSRNTTYQYTHYAFKLPNEDMSFKLSGNYVVQVYEESVPETPVAQACFNVVEPEVSVSADVRGNTDTELSGALQQLDFTVNTQGYPIQDATSEVSVVVRQNDRSDNEVTGIEPTYLSPGKLSYTNNKRLIFEGGNEYHRFDISSVYAAAEGVESIHYNRINYEAYLYPDKFATNQEYTQMQDLNGRYVINLQSSDEDSIEADYIDVNFSLPMENPYFDGQIYIGGELNNNLLNATNRMWYNGVEKAYTQKILLKQGGYNYQYWFVAKGSSGGSTRRVGGSYWQTNNEYMIYVYHRAFGQRYDKLIAVKGIQSN